MKLNNSGRLCNTCKKEIYIITACLNCKYTNYCSDICKINDVGHVYKCESLKTNYNLSDDIIKLLPLFKGFDIFKDKYLSYYGYIIDVKDTKILHQDLINNNLNWMNNLNKQEYTSLIFSDNYKPDHIKKECGYTIYTYDTHELFINSCIKTIEHIGINKINDIIDKITKIKDLYILIYCIDTNIIYMVEYIK